MQGGEVEETPGTRHTLWCEQSLVSAGEKPGFRRKLHALGHVPERTSVWLSVFICTPCAPCLLGTQCVAPRQHRVGDSCH